MYAALHSVRSFPVSGEWGSITAIVYDCSLSYTNDRVSLINEYMIERLVSIVHDT